jgi:hypothetical protein
MIDVYCLDFNKDYTTPLINSYIAYQGFKVLGGHCKLVSNNTEINDDNKENIAVGGIGFVKDRLKILNIEIPDVVDYPEEIQSYLGRNIWTSTINEIADKLPYCFIKPKHKQKFFTGLVIKDLSSLRSKGIQDDNYEVWCSDVIEPVAEFRCFVRYGKIIDIRKYKGHYSVTPDYNVIQNCIKDYKSAPLAYGIDFCVTKDNKTLLMEVNDAYALGEYGLFYIDYSKMLYTRWSEMVDCKDYFNF